MTLTFPEEIFFGTSTSAYQIETAFDHDWQGIVAQDGHIFNTTTDHEKRIEEDVRIIASLAPHYRMSLMWSRLQRHPYAPLDDSTKFHYHRLLRALNENRITIMMVLHHWANPIWFRDSGGWQNEKNIAAWIDYARKIVDEYGMYISYWNTFNEPNLYTTFSFALGEFPPYETNLLKSIRCIRHMGMAHEAVYAHIKSKYPDSLVGVSHNCVNFKGENIAGNLVARVARLWYLKLLPDYFQMSDFTGISYYARLGFDPMPITYLKTPAKIAKFKKAHDDIWEYHPAGLSEVIEIFWKRYKKPIIITENGYCTSLDDERIKAIGDYMTEIRNCLDNGIPILGYYHWTAWDNFEWTLGPTFKFGLYSCNPQTFERKMKPSAAVYSTLAFEKTIHIS